MVVSLPARFDFFFFSFSLFCLFVDLIIFGLINIELVAFYYIFHRGKTAVLLAKACRLNPAGPCFLTLSFCAFSDYLQSVFICRLGFPSSIVQHYFKLL